MELYKTTLCLFRLACGRGEKLICLLANFSHVAWRQAEGSQGRERVLLFVFSLAHGVGICKIPNIKTHKKRVVVSTLTFLNNLLKMCLSA